MTITKEVRGKLLKQLREVYRDVLIFIAYEDGSTITEIAKEWGLDKSTVSRIVKKNQEMLGSLE